MKKLIILCPVLILALGACSLPFFSSAPEDTPPAGESYAPEASVFADPADPGPSAVYADWSKLTGYEAPDEIYTRLSEKRLEELYPSGGYGRLLPYEGEKLYSAQDGWQIGSKRGFVTEYGLIVTDAVYSGISPLYRDDENGYSCDADMYVISVYREAEEPGFDSYEMYAIAASNGSWVTGFDFTGVYYLNDKNAAVGIIDALNNHLVWYDNNGKIIFDSRDFEELEELAPWTLAWGANKFKDGWCPVSLESGGYGYIDLEGRLMRSAVPNEPDGASGGEPPPVLIFEYAEAFSEGLAPVSQNGSYGFIDVSGNPVTATAYTSAFGFSDGKALVCEGGKYYAVDKNGGVLFEFPAGGSVYPQMTGGKQYYNYIPNAVYEPVWYDTDFKPVETEGKAAQPVYGTDAFSIETDEGVMILRDGKTVLLPGAESVYSAGKSGIAVAWMKDGGFTVFDAEGEPIAETGENYSVIFTDIVTGREYIFFYDENSVGKACDPETGEYVTNVTGAPINGLFPCGDSLTTGYKNSGNEWIFRIRLDISD
ncbi:MAG: WG repeat-containing protein [Oscillospiraceae bacterium]|nr:WG repeat-containing protein [Oscillospiraceae bacterium]